mgnify:CR=1 FL=1
MVNDFEESVFPQFPAIREIKEEMYRQGAVYASMSGSGSSVYGILQTKRFLAGYRFRQGSVCIQRKAGCVI